MEILTEKIVEAGICLNLEIPCKQIMIEAYKQLKENEIKELIEEVFNENYELLKTKEIKKKKPEILKGLKRVWNKHNRNKKLAEIITKILLEFENVNSIDNVLKEETLNKAILVHLDNGFIEILKTVPFYDKGFEISQVYYELVDEGILKMATLSKKDIVEIAKINPEALDNFFDSNFNELKKVEEIEEIIEFLQILSIFWDRACWTLGKKLIRPKFPELLSHEASWVRGVMSNITISVDIRKDAERYIKSKSLVEKCALYNAHLRSGSCVDPKNPLGPEIELFKYLTGNNGEYKTYPGMKSTLEELDKLDRLE